MNYTVDYFIKKFEAIPEELFAVRSIGEPGGPRCANGLCYFENQEGSECRALNTVFSTVKITLFSPTEFLKTNEAFQIYFENQEDRTYSRKAEQINNGHAAEYQQPTPRQRILAALYDIKKAQYPEVKERTVYVTVDAAVRELQKVQSVN